MVRFITLIVVGIALIGLSLWWRLSDPIGVDVVTEYADVSEDDLHAISDLVDNLTADTRFSGKVNINMKPQVDHLNLYVFDAKRLSKIDRRFNSFRENCAYTGWRNSVVCDLGLIDGFLSEHAMDREVIHPGGNIPIGQILPTRKIGTGDLKQLRRGMMLWVLGHEIGHAVAEHTPSHFQESQFRRFVHISSLSQERELQADRFVIDSLDQPDTEHAFFYFGFLVELLNRDIRLRLCPDSEPLQYCPKLQHGVGIIYNSEVTMAYASDGSHPEYLIRLLRMIDVADDSYGLGVHGYLAKSIIEHLLVRQETSGR